MICPFCNSPYRLDVAEIWGREFTLDGCCEDAIADACASIDDVPREELAAFFADRCGLGIRGLAEARIDWGLTIEETDYETAAAVVREVQGASS